MSLLLFGASLIVFLEVAFPSYTVYVQKEDGTIISYGVPKKDFLDENGMIRADALAKLEQLSSE